MRMRQLKNHLYEQVARIGKAMASPKRLELIELLCQGEKSVEELAAQSQMSLKLASAHLKELRQASLAQTRKEGRYVFYSLASTGVADLWVTLRSQAEERLVELQAALADILQHGRELDAVDRHSILERARNGEVLVLDVRQVQEFKTAHLPYARSLPLDELKARLSELPQGTPIVAYCRGPFCLLAKDAVELLRRKGFSAFHLTDGVAEWRARGLPLEQSVATTA
jgi:rhodanese-related sulfurtransferase